MKSESRILLILDYLNEKTDADHSVSTSEIKHMLSQHNISIRDTRTIESDVNMLIAAGYDIVKSYAKGLPTQYQIVSRDFDIVDLKTLMDAVAASQFIGPDRSKRIIEGLGSLVSETDRERLLSTIDVDTIKKAAGGKGYIADALYRAIVEHKKICFQLADYSVPDMQPTYHRDGKVYTVSPYAMVWNNDRYYLVAHEDERSIILTPRADRIKNIEILDEQIQPTPEGFDIGHYYSLYKMYEGPEAEITLECQNTLISKFIDHFGADFQCLPVSENTFQATVQTEISPTFFGWLFQYAGDIKLLSPTGICKQYADHLRKVANAQGI